MTAPVSHLSYSSIADFLLCNERWRFGRVEKRPQRKTGALVFGSTFHNVAEDMVLAEFEGRKFNPLRAWQDAWDAIEHDDIDWGSSSHASEGYDGQRLFANPDVKAALRSIRPWVENGRPLIEQKFELRFAGVPVPLIGFIDVVVAAGYPIDFKTFRDTEDGRWSQSKAERELQPLIYLEAQRQRGWPHNPERVFEHWAVGRDKLKPGVEVYRTRPSERDLRWLHHVVRAAWRAIESGRYSLNPKACFAFNKPCPFINECRWKEQESR